MTDFGRSVVRALRRGRGGECKVGSPFLFVLALASLAACSVDFAGVEPQQGGHLPADGDGDARDNQDDDGDGDGDAPRDTGDGDDGGDGDKPAPQPKSCGGTPNGQSEQRKRYAQAVVDDYQDCTSESQSRTCDDGTWGPWSGSAQAMECAVSALGICKEGSPCAEGMCTASKTMPAVSQCLRRNGTTCGDDTECVNRCIGSECADPSGAGDACDQADDCAPLACVGGSSGIASATCEGGLCVCPNQSTCLENAQCQGTCVQGQCTDRNNTCDFFDQDDCDDDAACVQQKCLRKSGAACTANAQCQTTLVCVNAKCGARSNFKGSCDENADCLGTYVCSPGPGERKCLRPMGASCTAANECASARCECSNQDCSAAACVEASP